MGGKGKGREVKERAKGEGKERGNGRESGGERVYTAWPDL